MKLISIMLVFSSVNVFNMDCAAIKSVEEIEKYLTEYGRTLGNNDDQLQTNLVFVYRLPTGEVALVPSLMKPESKGLLFANEECFQECLRNDSFPIENEDKEIFEYDQEGLRKIHESFSKYRVHLNKSLKLDYSFINRDNVQKYYEKILKMRKRKREDIIALGAVMGELLRQEVNGRWLLEKWYGTYNPYYKPLIVLPDGRIFSPYDKLATVFGGRWEDVKHFFSTNLVHGRLNALKQAGREIIELK